MERVWSGQKVVVLGAARQGLALARYLTGRGALVVLNDSRLADELEVSRQALDGLPVAWVCGGHPLSVLDGADCLCISGGVPLTLPLVVEAQARGILLTNDSQIFLEAAPCPVIGITGSAGKTTTTTLVGRMAEAAMSDQGLATSDQRSATEVQFPVPGSQSPVASHQSPVASRPPKAWIGGNIGTPLISYVDEMGPVDLAVMELSSFQLEIMTRSPEVAAVLNVTPNHLDRHGTMEAYTSAKAHILEHQTPGDVAVLGREDSGAWGLAGKVQGRLLTFGLGDLHQGQEGAFVSGEELFLRINSDFRLMSRSDILLRGEHNLLNVLAACTIAAAAGLPVEAMRAGVAGFGGVPHRLEFVRTWGGAEWFNDSIATAPERAMAAIRSFEEPLVLLAGGRDKSLPWEDFGDLVRSRVDHLILFGEAAGKVLEAVQGSGVTPNLPIYQSTNSPHARPYTITRCTTLSEAVHEAARIVQPGDVVLLSPGGASFDEFHDFEERGEWFKKLVIQL